VEQAASAIAGGYELEDVRAMPVAAASVVVFAPPGSEENPLVVVDFRPRALTCLPIFPRPTIRVMVEAGLLPDTRYAYARHR
jgi:hypothetical protein